MRPDLDAIRARCEAATMGPWEHLVTRANWNTRGLELFRARKIADDLAEEHKVVTSWIHGQAHDKVAIFCVAFSPYREDEHAIHVSAEDAEFIAAARSDVPVLLDYIRELEAALDLAIESLRRVVDRRANGAPATQDSSRLRHHDGLGLCDSGVDTHGEARTDGVGVIGLSLPPKEPRG